MPSFTDKIYGFLKHPVVSILVILGIIGGLYFEMQAPGIGLPLGVSITCAILYFLPNWIDGLAENWEILLFIVGCILIALEIFVVPGFGVTGIGGIILCIASLALALIDNKAFDFEMQQTDQALKALSTVLFAVLLGGILLFLGGGMLLNSKAFKGMQLETVLESGGLKSIPSEDALPQKGDTAIAFTDLKPEGKIVFREKIYLASTELAFIKRGSTVTILREEGHKWIVG